MKRILTLFVLAFAGMGTAASALDLLVQQHADFGLNFNSALVGTGTNPWRLTVRDEDAKHEYGGQRAGFGDTEEVLLLASAEAEFEVPDDPEYAFLGAPGAPVWVLPQTQEPGILFLGFSAENKTAQMWRAHNVAANLLARGFASGVFLSNQITLRLETFSGPGNFSVFGIGSFGEVEKVFDTSDGLSAADSRAFTPSNHTHFNWALTAPGDYSIGLRASGTLNDATSTQSDLTTFRFRVVPEPSSALLLFAASALVAGRRRFRSLTTTPTPSPKS
jgi:surface-anchored protein